jgi:hypothetical protein
LGAAGLLQLLLAGVLVLTVHSSHVQRSIANFDAHKMLSNAAIWINDRLAHQLQHNHAKCTSAPPQHRLHVTLVGPVVQLAQLAQPLQSIPEEAITGPFRGFQMFTT